MILKNLIIKHRKTFSDEVWERAQQCLSQDELVKLLHIDVLLYALGNSARAQTLYVNNEVWHARKSIDFQKALAELRADNPTLDISQIQSKLYADKWRVIPTLEQQQGVRYRIFKASSAYNAEVTRSLSINTMRLAKSSLNSIVAAPISLDDKRALLFGHATKLLEAA